MSNLASTNCPEKEATHRAVWEWGETVLVNVEEIPLFRQQAVNLGRSIDFHPIAPTESAPLERPERVALKAQVYSLEEEIAELRAKAASLYNEVNTLRADNRIATLKVSAADAAVKSAQTEAATLREQNVKLAREVSNLEEQVATLHALVGDVEAQSTALVDARKEIEELRGKLAAPQA